MFAAAEYDDDLDDNAMHTNKHLSFSLLVQLTYSRSKAVHVRVCVHVLTRTRGHKSQPLDVVTSNSAWEYRHSPLENFPRHFLPR